MRNLRIALLIQTASGLVPFVAQAATEVLTAEEGLLSLRYVPQALHDQIPEGQAQLSQTIEAHQIRRELEKFRESIDRLSLQGNP